MSKWKPAFEGKQLIKHLQIMQRPVEKLFRVLQIDVHRFPPFGLVRIANTTSSEWFIMLEMIEACTHDWTKGTQAEEYLTNNLRPLDDGATRSAAIDSGDKEGIQNNWTLRH